jgi:hypothetical protein
VTELLDLLPGSGPIYALIGVLGGVLALWVGGRARDRTSRQAGRSEAERDAARDTVERIEKGNEQVADNRGGDPADRLRDNDAKW